ncbi:hypothetical protein [Halococcus saccharolyticus]|uniref:hypothetical protein n=1 Tax=Halococcus saccharolyticus TaxID=62319 RepID=UPI000678130A|nr:hypothetical protein [Halococcus saccharolyticus]
MSDALSAEIPLMIAIERHRDELAGDELSDQERGWVEDDISDLDEILDRTRGRWGDGDVE